MTTAIWIHYARPRPHWYELGDDAKAELLSRWGRAKAASLSAGGELLSRSHIRGQHDFETAEVWRFTSAEASFDHWARLTAAGYNAWFAFANNVGAEDEAT